MSPQMRKGQRPRPPIAHLAGLGALGASGGLALLFLLFVFFTRPGATTMDGENIAISWIGVGGLIAALIAVHVLLGKRLLDLGKGVRRMP
jgi:hypothetical protein